MSFEEKNAWLYALITVVAYVTYVMAILERAQDVPWAEVSYVAPMLWSIGGAVVASVLGTILVVMTAPGDRDTKDERDLMYSRYGDAVGMWVLSGGVVGALGLTMAELPHFWIGNAIYLSFVLAALGGTVVRLLGYRLGFQPW